MNLTKLREQFLLIICEIGYNIEIVFSKSRINIEGIGDAPPEDVGGIQGYEEFLEIMANTKHPEYEGMKNWAESQRYKKFDIDLVNRRLKYVFWKW